MKIYTRTGDSGMTSLFSGKRISKSHHAVQVLGDLDEGNCQIGMALSLLPKEELFSNLHQQLTTIQHAVFDLGAVVATSSHDSQYRVKQMRSRFDHCAVNKLEQWIDHWEGILPPLHAFILPGGHPAAAVLHVARSVIRRAERSLVFLSDQETIDPGILIYLNRLSDYLFVVCRVVNHLLSIPDQLWSPMEGDTPLDQGNP